MSTLIKYKKQYADGAIIGLADLIESDIKKVAIALDAMRNNTDADNVRVFARDIHGLCVALLCVANQLEVQTNIKYELDAVFIEKIIEDFNNPKETT